MSIETKKQLLATAREQSYFKLDPPELDKLWYISADFIEKNRLICFEYEWFTLIEQHFMLSLLTCHGTIAELMLKRITDKFGPETRRVKALRAAIDESTKTDAELEEVFKSTSIEYQTARKKAMVVYKRQKQWVEYIRELVKYLDENPVDDEAWAELGETYAECGDFDSAIKSLEQVLVIQPMAYNVFARIGELKRLQAVLSLSQGFTVSRNLLESGLDHLCRSVELNPLYLRGWCGIVSLTSVLPDEQSGKLHDKALATAKKLAERNIGSKSDVEAANKLTALFSGQIN